jgi:Na+/H+ antiporter NhaC
VREEMDAVAYCQKLGTYQWISLIVAVIIVIIIIILLSLNFANNLNSSARQSDGSINLSSSQGKSTRTYNIISIVLLIVLLLIGILYVYGNYAMGKVTYQPSYSV